MRSQGPTTGRSTRSGRASKIVAAVPQANGGSRVAPPVRRPGVPRAAPHVGRWRRPPVRGHVSRMPHENFTALLALVGIVIIVSSLLSGAIERTGLPQV